MASRVRKFVRRLLCAEAVNWVVIRALKIPFVPERWGYRVPMYGVVKFTLPSGRRLRLKAAGDWLTQNLFMKGFEIYEPETLAVFLPLVMRADVVLDVGAHAGVFALAAAIENPNVKLFAFEPVPLIHRHLVENIRLNKLQNITPVRCAMSDFDGDTKFYVAPGNLPGESSLLPNFRTQTIAREVQAARLDSFVAKERIEKVDLLKVDTEGTEDRVFAGATDLIERDRPLIICEVLAGSVEERLHAELDRFGYQYFWITSGGLVRQEKIKGDSSYRDLNFLFVPENKISLLAEAGLNVGYGVKS